MPNCRQQARRRDHHRRRDDLVAGMLSVFIREPEFVGQTKDKLATVEAQRIVENAMRDAFDHWLADSPAEAESCSNGSSTAPTNG
jgi:DNA gyrase/topoisomerase IV subunit B